MDQHLTGMRCPHCKGPARVRTSRAVTLTYRQMTCHRLDHECGHTFGADLTVTHTIRVSACPDPNVVLRQSPPRRRRDELPVPANDPGGLEVPLVPANDAGADLTATG